MHVIHKGFTQLLHQADLNRYNEKTSTLDHLLSCAERHDDPQGVVIALADRLDAHLSVKPIPLF